MVLPHTHSPVRHSRGQPWQQTGRAAAASAAAALTLLEIIDPVMRDIRLHHSLALVWARGQGLAHPPHVPLIEVTKNWRLHSEGGLHNRKCALHR